MLTKAELTEAIVRTTKTTRREARVILEAIFDSMTEALVRDETIEIRRFGTFRTTWRAARTGMNPNGDRVDVPARRIAHFRPSRELMARVNGGVAGHDPSDDGEPSHHKSLTVTKLKGQ